MKNKVDSSSLNLNTGWESLEKFIESDAPGTLSWLNMADDLDIDPPPFKEIELSLIAPACTDTKPDKQGIRL